MGSIKTKYQDIVVGVSNLAKGNPKSKNSKLSDKKKSEKPKSSEGATNPPKEKEKKGKEKEKCTYCHKGWNSESSHMKKTIDKMAQLLQKNNIHFPDGARKKYGNSGFENKDKSHALVACSSHPPTFIIDSGASMNMSFSRDIFSSMHSNSVPTV